MNLDLKRLLNSIRSARAQRYVHTLEHATHLTYLGLVSLEAHGMYGKAALGLGVVTMIALLQAHD